MFACIHMPQSYSASQLAKSTRGSGQFALGFVSHEDSRKGSGLELTVMLIPGARSRDQTGEVRVVAATLERQQKPGAQGRLKQRPMHRSRLITVGFEVFEASPRIEWPQTVRTDLAMWMSSCTRIASKAGFEVG